MILYVEASAVTKLVLRETESLALEAFLEGMTDAGNAIVSSTLVDTELRRAVQRAGAPQRAATAVLDRFDLIEIDRTVYTAAGILPDPNLRSLDAIHVAAALAIGADLVVSYDSRQIAAAEAAGLNVASPA